jgi:4-hydroxy-3-methylbut-2-enyl diphosphate reductase
MSLAALCTARGVPTYHIEAPEAIDVARGVVRYRPVGPHAHEAEQAGWLPAGAVRVGLTAGASTPNSKIGETVARVLAMRGIAAADVLTAADAAIGIGTAAGAVEVAATPAA